jgi:hypothetical protein
MFLDHTTPAGSSQVAHLVIGCQPLIKGFMADKKYAGKVEALKLVYDVQSAFKDLAVEVATREIVNPEVETVPVLFREAVLNHINSLSGLTLVEKVLMNAVKEPVAAAKLLFDLYKVFIGSQMPTFVRNTSDSIEELPGQVAFANTRITVLGDNYNLALSNIDFSGKQSDVELSPKLTMSDMKIEPFTVMSGLNRLLNQDPTLAAFPYGNGLLNIALRNDLIDGCLDSVTINLTQLLLSPRTPLFVMGDYFASSPVEEVKRNVINKITEREDSYFNVDSYSKKSKFKAVTASLQKKKGILGTAVAYEPTPLGMLNVGLYPMNVLDIYADSKIKNAMAKLAINEASYRDEQTAKHILAGIKDLDPYHYSEFEATLKTYALIDAKSGKMTELFGSTYPLTLVSEEKEVTDIQNEEVYVNGLKQRLLEQASSKVLEVLFTSKNADPVVAQEPALASFAKMFGKEALSALLTTIVSAII